MAVTAEAVKALRERTGAGMMECKKALVETQGDLEAAAEIMRKSGLTKADKKAGRVAAEGVIAIERSADGRQAAVVEVNSETDFVAREKDFQAFAASVARAALDAQPRDLVALNAVKLPDGQTVEETRRALIARLGENMSVRRFVRMATTNGRIATYRHGVRIGVLVDLEGGSEELGKDLAMHIAASSPLCVDSSGVPADTIAKEREIYSAQAAESGKPANIVEKMVDGRIRKFLEEVTLVGQPFVKDPETTVGKLIAKAGANVVAFRRFEVGEGIEKRQEDFAAEVAKAAAAVQG